MKSKKSNIKIFLRVESKTENLSIVRKFVSNAAKEIGFDDDDINKIALAVDEACTNIIRHAYKNKSDKPIEIYITSKNKSIEIRIVDYGVSFEPQKIKKPVLKFHRGKFKGGLGMFLMRALMDKVEYSISRNNKNEVYMIKKLNNRNR